jgi:cyclopropane-fatty-acyl-phospholipid synthase
VTPEQKRLALTRDLLDRAVKKLSLRFGFRLWDGSEIAPAQGEHPLRIEIADDGVLASLIRRPSLDTFVRLHVDGRLIWTGGSLFDLAAMRPAGKIGRALRSIGLWRLLRAGLSLWRAPGAPRMAQGQGDAAGTRRADAATNKANIAHHYDVSNAFYRLFLDSEMVYTCGYFAPDFHDDLDKAQRDKLDMICRKLRLQAGDRLLDIGCGWGALICYAAQAYGVQAVGVTLSEEQADFVRKKIVARVLEGRVEVRLVDYNDLEAASFDKISSIGMFEHVGIDNHGKYFAAVHRLLKPGGLYLHHAITRPAKGSDRKFRHMRSEYRALVRYIFPGGELDHIGMSLANLERARFEVHDVEGWRLHYACTTRLWHDRLLARREEAEAAAGAETTRMWLLYLGGCSLAFERGAVGIFQTVASRKNKGALPVPATRLDLYR